MNEADPGGAGPVHESIGIIESPDVLPIWAWVVFGVLGGAVASGLIAWRDAPYRVSAEVEAKRVDPRIQLSDAEKAEVRQVAWSNSGYVVGVFGAVVGAVLGMVRGMWARSVIQGGAGCVVGGGLGLLFGRAGGLAGHGCYEMALLTGGDISSVKSMLMHAATLGITGVGIGLGVGSGRLFGVVPVGQSRIGLWNLRRWAGDVVRGGVAGACTGLWFVPLIALLVPLANSEPNIPRGLSERVIWIVGTAVVMGLVLGGVRERRAG